MNNFYEWLQAEIEDRNWSQAEFAKKSGISASQVSRVISGLRPPGNEFIEATSHALRLPPEEVFRRAGLLPPKPVKTEAIEELLHLASDLPPDQVQELIDLARLKLDRAQAKQKESRLKPALHR
jgi:transcriptional regulator with XRE-family HTH domain